MGVHHGWGRTLKDIWQRYAAMRGRDLLLPERLRLPGPVGRGRRREGARPQLQARDRGVRARPVRARLPRPGGELLRGAHRPVEAARPVDGLGAVVLHDDRPQHLLHLGLPQGLQRAGLALPGPPLDAVVPALRDVALPARADRLLQGPDAPVAVRPPAATAATASIWSCGRRRRGRFRPTSRRPSGPTPIRARPDPAGIAIVAAARLRGEPISGGSSARCAGPISWG